MSVICLLWCLFLDSLEGMAMAKRVATCSWPCTLSLHILVSSLSLSLSHRYSNTLSSNFTGDHPFYTNSIDLTLVYPSHHLSKWCKDRKCRKQTLVKVQRQQTQTNTQQTLLFNHILYTTVQKPLHTHLSPPPPPLQGPTHLHEIVRVMGRQGCQLLPPHVWASLGVLQPLTVQVVVYGTS